MKRYQHCLFLIIAASRLIAGEELVTDRPDQTESSSVVPKGSVQIETGAVLEVKDFADTDPEIKLSQYHLATTLIRYGLTDRLELRFGSEFERDKIQVGSRESVESGLNGLELAAKLALRDESGFIPEAAVIVSAGLPVGNKDLTGDQVTPGFLLAFSHTLSDKLGLGYNLGGAWDGDQNLETQYRVALGIGLTKSLGGFVEFYGFKPKNVDAQLLFDAGLTYLIFSNLQLDASFGKALTDEAMDWFVSGGVSIRLPE